ncbi:MAG: hypothetical protein OXC28_01655 [Defluviicoccus sp.]|nr:hypothetical protein [Defluviicoccus sp.]
MTARSLHAIAALLLLAGCGGGGGGGGDGAGPGASTPPSPSEPPFGAAVPADAGEVLESAGPSLYALLPASRIWFGSAALSAGPDVTDLGLTFDGRRARVAVERAAAGSVVLDTDDAYRDDGLTFSVFYGAVGSGRSSRDRYVYSGTANSATSGRVVVDWSHSDPADYIAGGYWLHAGAGSTGWEAGAYVVGPELSLSDPPGLPVSGTATYEGDAGGVYMLTGDFAAQRRDAGLSAEGDFTTEARLDADFAAGTVGGCIGCAYGLIDGSGSLALGTVSFDRSNGTFRGANVTLSTAVVSITGSSGKWAGQFSNIPDGSGAPRLAAGTFDATASTGDGSTVALVGAFGAGRTR